MSHQDRIAVWAFFRALECVLCDENADFELAARFVAIGEGSPHE